MRRCNYKCHSASGKNRSQVNCYILSILRRSPAPLVPPSPSFSLPSCQCVLMAEIKVAISNTRYRVFHVDTKRHLTFLRLRSPVDLKSLSLVSVARRKLFFRHIRAHKILHVCSHRCVVSMIICFPFQTLILSRIRTVRRE